MDHIQAANSSKTHKQQWARSKTAVVKGLGKHATKQILVELEPHHVLITAYALTMPVA